MKKSILSLVIATAFAGQGLCGEPLDEDFSRGENASVKLSLEVSSEADIAKNPAWTNIGPGVWSSVEKGVQRELAFGEAANERALAAIEDAMVELQSVSEKRGLTEREQLKMMELELDFDEIQASLSEKLLRSDSTKICYGRAVFESEFGYLNFTTPWVRTHSHYSEFGPLVSSTKRTYAFGRIGQATVGYNWKVDRDSVSGFNFLLQSDVTVYPPGPTFGCNASSEGYVQITDALDCSQTVFLTDLYIGTANCTEF